MSAPIRMLLEIRSPVSGRWSVFERGEHEIADYILNNVTDGAIDARIRMTKGRTVTVAMGEVRYECRFTPADWPGSS